MLRKLLNEVKAISIGEGDTFTLSGSIGKFTKGEKVEVLSVSAFGNDVELLLVNDKGVKDTFYLDRNDDFEELG